MKKYFLSFLCLLWPLVILLSCGPKAAPIVTTPSPVVTAFEQKMRWILQLEDARQLRGGGGDLTTLIGDTAGNVRRRSALAIGRVK